MVMSRPLGRDGSVAAVAGVGMAIVLLLAAAAAGVRLKGDSLAVAATAAVAVGHVADIYVGTAAVLLVSGTTAIVQKSLASVTMVMAARGG